MIVSLKIALALLATATVAQATVLTLPEIEECSSTVTDENREMAYYLDTYELPSDLEQNINIDTYMHVVAETKDEAGGYLPREIVEKQFKVLVDSFKDHDISFTLKDITWTVNADWSNHKGSNLNFAMKKALRKGSYAALNLYYLKKVDQHNGYCYYPVANPGDQAITQDGCVQRMDTMPGVGDRGYAGFVTTHEVGHWLSLLHTFENGCNSPGDHVDDTPAENHKDRDACKERDSCPNSPGKDPIHNYMAYVFDTCRKEFSPGQVSRMKKSWAATRRGK